MQAPHDPQTNQVVCVPLTYIVCALSTPIHAEHVLAPIREAVFYTTCPLTPILTTGSFNMTGIMVTQKPAVMTNVRSATNDRVFVHADHLRMPDGSLFQ